VGCCEPFVSVCDLFERQAHANPGSTALDFGTRKLTYGELNGAANQIAWRILDAQASSTHDSEGSDQKPVVVLLEMGPSGITAALAALKAGQIYVPVDPSDPAERVERIFAELEPAWVIVSTDSLARWQRSLPPHADVINIDELNLPETRGNPGLKIHPDALACVIFTSGSTGQPKGVMLPHKKLVHDALIRSRLMAVSATDSIVLLSWATGQAISTLLLPLINGAQLVPVPVRRDGISPLVEVLSQKAITILVIAVPLLRALMDSIQGRFEVPQLRVVRIASDRSYPHDVKRFRDIFPPHCTLMNGLSSSETGLICAQMIDASMPLEEQTLSVGRPVDGKEVLILDKHTQPTTTGFPGRIAIRSRYLSTGYWRRPELTAQSFRQDSEDPTLRLFLSSDMGYLCPDGTLVFLDRLDEQIKIRGLLVDTNEVQAALMSHPNILECFVGGWGDQGKERLLVAWIVIKDVPLASIDLRGFIESRLASHMVPSAFVAVDSLPLTARGKIDRNALPPPRFAGDSQRRMPPSTELEQQLHGIWSTILGHADFGITDDFFAIGGDSLSMMQANLAINRLLNKDHLAHHHFTHRTIQSLINHFEPEVEADASSETAEAMDNKADRNHRLIPPHIRSFPAQQMAMLAHWPGECAGGHRYLRTLNNESTLPGLFWCFQGSYEFEALARELTGELRLHGMRSANQLEDYRTIYRNPSLCNHIASLYVEEILDLQPANKPFVIGGNCQAAIIANAIAWQLLALGCEVKNLILMEASLVRIRTGIFRWDGKTTLIYGARSIFNPFGDLTTANRTSGIREIYLEHHSGSWLDRTLQENLGDELRILEIAGAHGTFFEARHVGTLALAIRRAAGIS
jgi:acyl-CoA synthetase (AMP-forming)/AMP-acid ligase II